MEKWKIIEGYDYMVSSYGRVKHINRDKCLSDRITNGGYNRVSLHKDGYQKNYSVHRLVAKAFIDNKENLPEVNHIDGNKLNNNVSNLEWISKSGNIRHRCDILLSGVKAISLEKNGIIYSFNSIREASLKLNLDGGNLSRVLSGKRNSVRGYRKIN